MQKTFKSAVAGSALLASTMVASADMPKEPEYDTGEVVFTDETVTIRQHPTFKGMNNNLVVVCPGNDFHDTLTDMQPEERTKPQVFLGNNPYEEIKTLLTQTFERNAGIRNQQFPSFNVVLVDKTGNLHPTYTLSNMLQTLGKIPENELSGTDSRDPKFLSKARNHAVNFCFGMF